VARIDPTYTITRETVKAGVFNNPFPGPTMEMVGCVASPAAPGVTRLAISSAATPSVAAFVALLVLL
jgi:hypothetical protein